MRSRVQPRDHNNRVEDSLDDLMQKYPLRAVLFIGVFTLALGFVVGIFWPRATPELNCRQGLTFISASARCGSNSVISKAAYSSLRNNLIDVIESWKKTGKVSQASVYFRDLHSSGPTFSIDANTSFSPASLLKVPMALTFLRLSEEEYPDLLSRKLTPVKEEWELVQYFNPQRSAEYGRRYSISELLDFSLRYSDNTSYFALYNYLVNDIPEGEGELLQTFKELGILDSDAGIANFISVREYSALFRQLYNASYLGPELSNSTLSRLGGLEQGIKGGVPAGVRVASKFGERGFDDGFKQLHDCGIVYYPDNPYIICIMTEGTDWDDLSEVIREVARMVYREVDSRRLESF